MMKNLYNSGFGSGTFGAWIIKSCRRTRFSCDGGIAINPLCVSTLSWKNATHANLNPFGCISPPIWIYSFDRDLRLKLAAIDNIRVEWHLNQHVTNADSLSDLLKPILVYRYTHIFD